MRVILEVLSGEQEGREIALHSNQTVRIGRTAWADVVVPHDASLSSIHFQLRTDSVACYLSDANSRHGTLVNGQAVAETVLRDGDEIRAGNTSFSVRIVGDQPEKAAPVAAASSPTLTRSTAHVSAFFTVQQTASGYQRFAGSLEQIAPAQLAAILANTAPLIMIVDLHRIPVPQAVGDSPQYLYDSLEPPARQQMSPVLVEAADCDNWPTIVQEGWGCDALICCYTRQPFPLVASALCSIGRGPRGGPAAKAAERAAAIVGIGWPSILAAIFDSQAKDILEPWGRVVEFVLMESPQDPQTWALYGPPSLGEVLRRAGLTSATGARAEASVGDAG